MGIDKLVKTLTVSYRHLSDFIPGVCLDFNWAIRWDLVITSSQY